MKFSFADTKKIGWEGLKAWIYSSKEDFPNASSIYFEVTGAHGKIKTTLSDRVYFVIEGEGEFIINDKVVSVKEKDVIIVPKNTPYNYRAVNNTTLKLFLVHTPAYDAKYEVQLEEKK